MKRTTLLLILTLTSIVFVSSCKKVHHDPRPQTPSCTETDIIAQEDKVITGGSNPLTYKKVYKYNSSNKIVKIEYTYAPNTFYTYFDTIIYNGGNVSFVNTYSTADPANPTRTNQHFYTGSRQDSINDIGTNGNGPYNKMVKFTYVSGVLSAQTVRYDLGTSPAGNTDISSITYTNGNVSSDVVAAGAVTLTTETTAPNPFLGLNISNDILILYNSNNVTSGYLTASPSTILFSTSYTYKNGKVKTITSGDGNGGTLVNTITYVCL
jgi:hypothetical protein